MSACLPRGVRPRDHCFTPSLAWADPGGRAAHGGPFVPACRQELPALSPRPTAMSPPCPRAPDTAWGAGPGGWLDWAREQGPALRALPLPEPAQGGPRSPYPLSAAVRSSCPTPCRTVCQGTPEGGRPHSRSSGANEAAPCGGGGGGENIPAENSAGGSRGQEPWRTSSTCLWAPFTARSRRLGGLSRASGESSTCPPRATFTPFLWLSPCKCPAPRGDPAGSHTPSASASQGKGSLMRTRRGVCEAGRREGGKGGSHNSRGWAFWVKSQVRAGGAGARDQSKAAGGGGTRGRAGGGPGQAPPLALGGLGGGWGTELGPWRGPEAQAPQQASGQGARAGGCEGGQGPLRPGRRAWARALMGGGARVGAPVSVWPSPRCPRGS